jgi:methylthioribose-1-phosphate isomerase
MTYIEEQSIGEGPLQSLRWTGEVLDLLDQRLLPEEIVYLPLETPTEVWEAIRHLKVRGAPAIGIAAAYGVYLGVRGLDLHGCSEEEAGK